MIIAVLSASALAQSTIPIETYTFPSGETMDGRDGWVSGYPEDSWLAGENDGYNYVVSLTDDNGGSFGSGEAADNWLVYTPIQRTDAAMVTAIYTEDDDAVGLVFGFQDAENYYLFLMSQGSSPIDLPRGTESALIKIEDGEAEILASSDASYTIGAVGSAYVIMNDNVLYAAYWSGEFDDAPDIALYAEDSTPFEGGSFGFYAYDAGYDNNGSSNTNTIFTSPTFLDYDEDDDGIADDDDNCEFIANPGQEDEDSDGVGNDCDDDYDPNNSGGDDTGNGNNDDTGNSSNDTGETDGVLDIEDSDIKLGPGCSALGMSGGLWLVGMSLLGLLRRRNVTLR
ncbi:MAG: hypothetical protein ACI8S6_002492 [Myxococcota bacterium]|jgi:hypothetical protein